MYSLITNANYLGINYDAFSLSIKYSYSLPSNAFIDNDNSFFQSEDNNIANQWWQVSFNKPVEIKSYIIRANPKHGAQPMSWVVNSSFDNVSWKTIDTVSLTVGIGGNKTPFNLSKAIRTQHFRIILKKNTYSSNEFLFSFFDCFGKLSLMNSNKNLKYKLFINVLLSSFLISFNC